MSKLRFNAGNKVLNLDRTYIMGILNVTPDSFSDGGLFQSKEDAINHAHRMINDGADIIDIGGQSTRPGHTKIPQEIEWERIKEVVDVLLRSTDAIISVDTFYPKVARKAVSAGVHIINDVTGFKPEMWDAVKDSSCGCIIMYPDGGMVNGVLQDTFAFFMEKLHVAKHYGVDPERICFDPGIGFGKTNDENLLLLANSSQVRVDGVAYLMAASRKRVIGAACGDPPFSERMAGTIAAHSIACFAGANILRVHDVKEAVQAALVTDALLRKCVQSEIAVRSLQGSKINSCDKKPKEEGKSQNCQNKAAKIQM